MSQALIDAEPDNILNILNATESKINLSTPPRAHIHRTRRSRHTQRHVRAKPRPSLNDTNGIYDCKRSVQKPAKVLSFSANTLSCTGKISRWRDFSPDACDASCPNSAAKDTARTPRLGLTSSLQQQVPAGQAT